jgi:hypothetical protein
MILNGSSYNYLTKGCTDGFDYCTMVNSIICPVYNASNCLCQTCSSDRCNGVDYYPSFMDKTTVTVSNNNEAEDIKIIIDSKCNNLKYKISLNLLTLLVSYSFFYFY